MPVDAVTSVHERADAPGRASLAQRCLLRVIRGYQLLFAPMYAGSCRYLPSCSAYAAEAIERHGAARGAALAIGRLSRCHPFGGHGHDPVPAFAPSELRRGKPGVAAELRRDKPRVAAQLRRGKPSESNTH